MRGRDGLTYFELVVVVVIMAALLGAVMPTLDAQLVKTAVSADADRVAYDLHMTQQYALSRREGYGYYGIQFSNTLTPGTALGYSILRYEPVGVTPPMAADPAPAPTVVKGPVFLNSRVVFSAASKITPADPGNARVIFTPLGSATMNGVALFTQGLNNSITLQSADKRVTRTIIISPVTGHVEIQ